MQITHVVVLQARRARYGYSFLWQVIFKFILNLVDDIDNLNKETLTCSLASSSQRLRAPKVSNLLTADRSSRLPIEVIAVSCSTVGLLPSPLCGRVGLSWDSDMVRGYQM